LCQEYGDCCPDYEAECSTPLAGTWVLTGTAGYKFTVTLEPEGDNKLRLNHAGVDIVPDGLYEIQGAYLVMIQSEGGGPSGHMWEIIDDHNLYLTNTDYAGDTMTKVDSITLAGTWVLTNINGGTFNMTLQPEGDDKLRLNHSGVNVVWDGLYEIQGAYLVMIEPENPSFNGFSWRIVDNYYLLLANTAYEGSTLTR
jgi:hypothetical protein